jgi:glycosyltransferase involved in cell wall biosynthesis
MGQRLVGLVPFHILPPRFGGAERAYHLLTRLGPIEIIALNWQGLSGEKVDGDVTYKLIAASPKAVERAEKLRAHGVKTFDPMPMLTRSDLTELRDAIGKPDAIILEHPWLVPFANAPFVYDAHNAEARLTAERWPGSVDAQAVRELEKQAVENARAITYCSQADANTLRASYNITAPMTYIPNGQLPPSETAHLQSNNLIFIGSVYEPNVRAAQALADLGRSLPEYKIQILGKCAEYVKTDSPNVTLVGEVTDEQMHHYFVNAYAFVNLVNQGSGSHLKLARALSYGLPIITTAIGARGYDDLIVVNSAAEIIEGLPLIDLAAEKKKNLIQGAKLSWGVIGESFREVVRASLP